MKLDMLAIGAHPDDIELACSGTIAKEIAKGKKVGVLDLTRGELGTRGTAEIRDTEAKAAGEILNLSVRENLAFRDGFFVNDEKHQIEVIKIIRKYKPEIVLCNAVHDRHVDHGKGSKLVSDSCFLSGLRRIETLVNEEKQEAWRPKHVYHYIQWYDIKPDFIVDISDYMDVKMESILAYRSQFYDPSSTEPEIPISTKMYRESIKYKAYDLGRIAGVQYAEAFTTERYVAVDSVFDLI
ncbi:bacillithiol biosynthesis deacetylase BshB1 [Aquimarina algiphila]|uniref:Bacillithiol biosynthesis deacetylase BshB1 n=1 Tax=Aquimarina algiphila TaxID=2047982 RepID=A0A554VN58_9FLAO|nr:bacillithiol biosynthesis deacetylase BshB1 [Aquimarina algiphila]TSE09795.1 bacillithiol biosynthesis deacetylase BshB1 [Aquimarina algiphila]